MKIEIEIPKDFECDYKHDKFERFFMSVSHDIEMNEYLNRYLCGNYEKETAEMFAKAFENSKEIK